MDSLDREAIEEEIRTLGRQCKCFSREGPCRFCLKADGLNAKLDKLQAEDSVIRDVVAMIRANAGTDPNQYHYFLMAADLVERGEWRKKS
jgi:hypothetical protein